MTSDHELEGLLSQVNKAVRGEGVLSKADTYTAMKRIARRLAKEGETPEKAFVRLFTERTSPGLPVFRAYQQPSPAAPGTIAKAMSIG